ncbi:MAG: alpha/beta hydrolase [Chloroflexota bacterium]|nr:alpha/beta hydrolase [Chloroflexota bacterium]
MLDRSTNIQDSKIELPDGKMHYLLLGEGSPIVLLHSLASSVWSWAKVLEPLAQKHTVYALDTMGEGDSDKPCRDYTIEDYAQGVIDFMRAKGIIKATLIGNSVGAIFAAVVAVTEPTILEKLILVGCPCRETEQEREDAMAATKASYDDRGIPLPFSLEDLSQYYVHISPELQTKVNEDRAKAGMWAWKCRTAMTNFDIVPVLKKVEAETLLIFGEKDILRDKEKALNNHIRNSKLIIIPDAGHLPQLDNPKTFSEVVETFLES